MRTANGKSIASSPWIFIPAVYLIAGTVESGILQHGVTIMYKDLGYSNAFIGFLSFLQLPLLVAFLVAPYVDRMGSKRGLTIAFMFIMAAISLLIPFTFYLDSLFTVASLTALFLLAISFACFKIASEGYYIRILSPHDQAAFIGIKTAAIRLGIIFTISLLVGLAGRVNLAAESERLGWQSMFFVLVALTGLAALYNWKFLPRPLEDRPNQEREGFALARVMGEYLKQEKALLLIIFILIYRFGEGLLLRMADPFFMDPVDLGGMAMGIPELVAIKSFAAIPGTIVGGIIGGWLVARYGLRRTFLPLSALMCIPNLGFWYLAHLQPMVEVTIFGMSWKRDVLIVVVAESVGYGMGFSAFFYYLHKLAVGVNKTSLLAISFALMALGIYLPSMISGVVQEWIGYELLFIVSFALAIPGVILTLFVPLGRSEQSSDTREKI